MMPDGPVGMEPNDGDIIPHHRLRIKSVADKDKQSERIMNILLSVLILCAAAVNIQVFLHILQIYTGALQHVSCCR